MFSLTPNDYTIVWICALPLKAAAASAMLEKTHTPPPLSYGHAIPSMLFNTHLLLHTRDI
jgi:hypothetical protein